MRANAGRLSIVWGPGAAGGGGPQRAGGLCLYLAAVQPPRKVGADLQAEIRCWSRGPEWREALLGVGRRSEMRSAQALCGHSGVLGSGVGCTSGPWTGLQGPRRPSARLNTRERTGPESSRRAPSQAWLRQPASWIGECWVPGLRTGHVQTCPGGFLDISSLDLSFPTCRMWSLCSLLGHLLGLPVVFWGAGKLRPSAWHSRPCAVSGFLRAALNSWQSTFRCQAFACGQCPLLSLVRTCPLEKHSPTPTSSED